MYPNLENPNLIILLQMLHHYLYWKTFIQIFKACQIVHLWASYPVGSTSTLFSVYASYNAVFQLTKFYFSIRLHLNVLRLYEILLIRCWPIIYYLIIWIFYRLMNLWFALFIHNFTQFFFWQNQKFLILGKRPLWKNMPSNHLKLYSNIAESLRKSERSDSHSQNSITK